MAEAVEIGPLESEPGVAGEVFGEHLERVRQLANDLYAHGEELGLMGPREYPRLWTRHLLNCGIIAPAFHGVVADVGSGAGLPGLVLAIQRPDLRWTLIEPMARRVAWLQDEATRLGLENVTVVRARAQEVEPAQFDMITARAVSALKTLLPMSAPLLRPGGEFLFMKGRSAADEIEAARKALRKAGIELPRVEVFGEGLLEEPTTVVRGTV